MKTIIFLLAFAVSGCAQSYHIIRVIPASTTPGSVLFCGDASHATTCVTDTANSAGTVVSTDGSRIVGASDDAYLAVDAGGSARIGFTKKSGFIPRLTYGSGQNFELAQSSGTDIGASNTFTVHFSLDQTTGAPNFAFNNASAGMSLVQSGAGPVLTASVSNGSTMLSMANSGSGSGAVFSVISGSGVSGSSTSGFGASGTTGSGTGVFGQATGGGGVAGAFSAIGTLGVGVTASASGSGGLAAHFLTGNVTVDNTLTAGALAGPQPGGVNATGATVVGDAFQIATSGGGRIYSTGGSAAVVIGRNALASDLVLDTSGNFTVAHNLALSGTFSGTHAQNIGTGDIVTFAGVTASNGLTVSANGASISANAGFAGSTLVNAGAGVGVNITSGGTTSASFSDSGGTCFMRFSAGGVTCPSDERLKTHIVKLGPELANVMRLRPVSFDWRQSGQPADGLIAQEVQRVFPLVVHKGDDGYLNVSYQQLIPYLIRSIQELKAQVDTLRRN